MSQGDNQILFMQLKQKIIELESEVPSCTFIKPKKKNFSKNFFIEKNNLRSSHSFDTPISRFFSNTTFKEPIQDQNEDIPSYEQDEIKIKIPQINKRIILKQSILESSKKQKRNNRYKKIGSSP